MRILVDTHVVLDLLFARKPFVSDAARIFTMVERGSVEGVLSATTLTTIDYLLRQSLSKLEAREAVRKLLSLFEVASVNRVVLAAAVESSMRDFEDAVLAQSANHSGVERIVTRNTSDFSQTPVIAVDPPEFLAQLTENTACATQKIDLTSYTRTFAYENGVACWPDPRTIGRVDPPHTGHARMADGGDPGLPLTGFFGTFLPRQKALFTFLFPDLC